MYLKIGVPKDIKISQIVKVIQELDKWTIDYEFNQKEWVIDLLTIPANEKVIRDIVKKYAKEIYYENKKV